MACACPTIFSQRGSGPELLTHGREGLLVDPDKPEEIGASILRVLQNPAFARQLGEAGRTRIHEAFSIDRLVAQNVSFYEKLRGRLSKKVFAELKLNSLMPTETIRTEAEPESGEQEPARFHQKLVIVSHCAHFWSAGRFYAYAPVRARNRDLGRPVR